MPTILGIDPGSRITGYGLINCQKGKVTYVASGCIRLTQKDAAQRLQQIEAGVSEVIAKYQPELAAIESVFMHRNPNSAIKLGQARGVALMILSKSGLEIGEYSPRQIKQAVVGTGAATKSQMQYMVQAILQLSAVPQADAADALAVAICHANMQHSGQNDLSMKKYRRGRIIEDK